MNRIEFIKTCAALGLAIPLGEIALSSTFHYDQDAEAIIKALIKARADIGVGEEEKQAIRMWVKLCKQSGAWDKLDVIYSFKDPAMATINLRNPILPPKVKNQSRNDQKG